jgi:hypothetical protein
MKKLLAIVAIVAFAIFAITDTVHDFVANNTISYFAEQPHRLFLVAIIGVVGGVAALIFDKLSSKTKRSVKLFVVGSAASCLTFFAGYFLFMFIDVPLTIKINVGHLMLIPICFGLIAAVLWFEFYQIFKKKNKS